jgi:predicted acylesterase/phospholipase RssA
MLPADQVKYDVVTGVSAGALNAGGISIFKIGNEVEMSEWLVSLW